MSSTEEMSRDYLSKPQDYFGLRLFQTFQTPALSSIEGFNRSAPFITEISPFQAFQAFNRFAPFKTFPAKTGSKRSKVPFVPIVPL